MSDCLDASELANLGEILLRSMSDEDIALMIEDTSLSFKLAAERFRSGELDRCLWTMGIMSSRAPRLMSEVQRRKQLRDG